MRFTILQQDLVGPLQAVARSTGQRAQLPVLSNILLQVGSGKLHLSATNLEIGVVKSLTIETEEEGELSVPAKTLVEVVANLSGEKISFEGDESHLRITTPSFSSELNGIPASEFPAIPLSGKQEVVVDPKLLLKALPEVTFAAAVDEARPVLTGILTEFKDQKLELVATDAYRLAHKSLVTEESSSFKALIPRKTFEEITRLLSEEEVDQTSISISDDANQMIFSFGSTQLSSRLIEGQFPAWEKIIPPTSLARIVVDRAELLKAVKLASVFARSETNILKLTNSKGKITLSSSAKELGSQTKELEASSEGDSIEIVFNTRFLQEALSAVSSSQVMIELSGPLSAAVIKPMGEAGLEYIIMPVNLS